MLSAQITSLEFPTFQLSENDREDILAVSLATGYSMFPVLNKEIFVGLISIKDLNALPANTRLSDAQNHFLKAALNEKDYFLSAFKLMSLTQYPILPVVNTDNQYCGTITQQSLLNALGIFLDIQENNGGVIVLQMDKLDYSFSEISRLIESDNASITHLNTYFDIPTAAFIVSIKINRMNVSEIIATLQRFDYQILYSTSEEIYENELKRNYEGLMNYLNI
ncbi:CBS domain-containing protein [Arachidicoccus soli]|uniref:CBS domain-containing protein n=1 Tax=Arachidicoccus soli TaxID=2341117 RepID=A0A386HTI5_9BACT|nr:CBS domain-containing protein [Arachidicoccus soli]AYD48791.1 CBS domain-containing protein [Arachidicoccus soli]